MTVRFDLDFVTFRCKHPECGEIFEKSSRDLAGADEAICPRCGTAARLSDESELLVAANGVRFAVTVRGAGDGAANRDKAIEAP